VLHLRRADQAVQHRRVQPPDVPHLRHPAARAVQEEGVHVLQGVCASEHVSRCPPGSPPCASQSPIERLIFTSSPDRDFETFEPSELPYSDAKLAIRFETQAAMEETLILLRFNCPEESCEVASAGWSDLKGHVRREHQKMMW
jgi:hypothetical protein